MSSSLILLLIAIVAIFFSNLKFHNIMLCLYYKFPHHSFLISLISILMKLMVTTLLTHFTIITITIITNQSQQNASHSWPGWPWLDRQLLSLPVPGCCCCCWLSPLSALLSPTEVLSVSLAESGLQVLQQSVQLHVTGVGWRHQARGRRSLNHFYWDKLANIS